MFNKKQLQNSFLSYNTCNSVKKKMIQKVSKAFKLHSSESCEFLMHQRIKFFAAAFHGTVRIKLLGRLDPTLAPYSVVTLPKQ